MYVKLNNSVFALLAYITIYYTKKIHGNFKKPIPIKITILLKGVAKT